MSDIVEKKNISDWSSLPKDLYVVSVEADGVVFAVQMYSVPMAIGPEVRYTQSNEITRLRAELEKAREWLADVDTASLPNDFPLAEMARIRMQTLHERTLEGLALIGKVERLTAALTALEATGMVMVPAEPTEKMISALQRYAVCVGDVEEGYRAMIAARPTAPAPGQ